MWEKEGEGDGLIGGSDGGFGEEGYDCRMEGSLRGVGKEVNDLLDTKVRELVQA